MSKQQKFRVADSRFFEAAGSQFIFLVDDGTIFEIAPALGVLLGKFDPSQEYERSDFFLGKKGKEEPADDLFRDLAGRRVLLPAQGGGQVEEKLPSEGTGQVVERLPAEGSGQVEALHPAEGAKQVGEKLPVEGSCRVAGKIPGVDEVPLSTLVLQITDRCNLGCRYCYHHTESDPGAGMGAMDLSVAERSVDFLLDRSGSLEKVLIVFFGGEPLINLPLIAHVVDYTEKEARGMGKKVEYSLTTNGTLLSSDAVTFLTKHRIGVTVSMDGFAEAHDRYRVFPGGAPSYAKTLSGVNNLLKHPGARPSVARVTLAKETAGDVPGILDHLLSLGFVEVGFAPVTTGETALRLDTGQMDLLLEQFRELAERFVDHGMNDRFLGFTNLIDLLVSLNEGEKKSYPCGAGLGLFSVDPTGKLFLCQRLIGEEDAHMGDVFNGFMEERLISFRSSACIDEKETCCKCRLRNICAGGCYHEAKTRQGRITLHNSHYCNWLKKWVEIGFNAYGTLATGNPGFLEKLSMSRGHAPYGGFPV